MFRRMVADFARAEFQRCLVADQLAPLRAVGLGKQHFGGDAVEIGIAVVGVAVGVRQLHGFRHGVDVVGRIQPHFADGETFQNVERFDHRRSLAPESGLINGVAVERGGDGLFGRNVKCGHVFVAKQSAVLLAELADAAGDIAAVEVIAHGFHRLGARGAGGQRFLFDVGHVAQGAGQVRLAENVAGLQDRAVGHVDALGTGPRGEIAHAVGERDGAKLV